MSSDNTRLDTPTISEKMLEELHIGDLQSEKLDSTEEVIDYLLYLVRLSKKKTQSRKLRDVVKVKWAKVAVDASKTLLFSGALNKRSKNQIGSYQALFMSVIKGETQEPNSQEEDRLAME